MLPPPRGTDGTPEARGHPSARPPCVHPHRPGKLCFAPRFTANTLKRQLSLLIRSNYQFRDPESSISETLLHSSSSCSLLNISTASHQLGTAKATVLPTARSSSLFNDGDGSKQQSSRKILFWAALCCAALSSATPRLRFANPTQGAPRAAGALQHGASPSRRSRTPPPGSPAQPCFPGTRGPGRAPCCSSAALLLPERTRELVLKMTCCAERVCVRKHTLQENILQMQASCAQLLDLWGKKCCSHL